MCRELRLGKQTPKEWIERLGIPQNAQVILFMGRLHPTKGVDRLVKAFLSVRKKFPKAVLICAGPDEFGIQNQLDSMSDDENAENSRVLFPGMVSGDHKKALLARADLFCPPSDAEGFSIAVLEAMASRTAVLLSPRCHFAEVEAANAGKIVSLDPEDIAKAITELIADRRYLASMGVNAFELVRQHYNGEYIVDKLITLYTAVLAVRTAE